MLSNFILVICLFTGFPIVNDPLYNHVVFGPTKGKNGEIGKSDEDLIRDLITIHNAENWLGGEGDDFAPGFFSSSAVPASLDPSSVGVAPDETAVTHEAVQPARINSCVSENDETTCDKEVPIVPKKEEASIGEALTESSVTSDETNKPECQTLDSKEANPNVLDDGITIVKFLAS